VTSKRWKSLCSTLWTGLVRNWTKRMKMKLQWNKQLYLWQTWTDYLKVAEKVSFNSCLRKIQIRSSQLHVWCYFLGWHLSQAVEIFADITCLDPRNFSKVFDMPLTYFGALSSIVVCYNFNATLNIYGVDRFFSLQ
jgi:hypothetical protein